MKADGQTTAIANMCIRTNGRMCKMARQIEVKQWVFEKGDIVGVNIPSWDGYVSKVTRVVGLTCFVAYMTKQGWRDHPSPIDMSVIYPLTVADGYAAWSAAPDGVRRGGRGTASNSKVRVG
jgi:hypothetical protein